MIEIKEDWELGIGSKKLGYRIIVLILIFMPYYPLPFPNKVLAETTVDLQPSDIGIDLLYHGHKINVSGTTQQGTDIIMTITSPEEHQTLKKKGKVGGLLWMNIETLNFKKVPSLYILSSTKKIEDILSREERCKYLIGYESLERHADISPVSNDQGKLKWWLEFVKFHEASKLYEVSYGRITLKQEVNGLQSYYVSIDWPYQAAPGTYTVTIYAVRNGKVVEKAEKNLFVKQVGIIKSLANMARDKGALYGIISIVVALIAPKFRILKKQR